MMKVVQNSLPLHSKRTYWLRGLSNSLSPVHSRIPLSYTWIIMMKVVQNSLPLHS